MQCGPNWSKTNMLTIAEAIEAITGFRPQATTVITEAGIDSRQTIPGSLFVAIPREKTDGLDYVAEAFKRGTTFALIQRDAFADPSFHILSPRTASSTDSLLTFD